LRARVRGRPDRGRGRSGAGRTARGVRVRAFPGDGRGVERAGRTMTMVIPSGMPQYAGVPRLDGAAIRADFPVLDREVNGHRVVYLDSGNTAQKPRQVLDAVREHYERHNANVARSVHTLGTESTEAYEGARRKVAAFIGASSADEVVFVKNATEAINLVA